MPFTNDSAPKWTLRLVPTIGFTPDTGWRYGFSARTSFYTKPGKAHDRSVRLTPIFMSPFTAPAPAGVWKWDRPFSFDIIHATGGGGIRLLWDRDFVVGLEFAWSEEGYGGAYFSVGQAF